jgi:cellulose biosynthesis protein BcsQ
LAVNRLRDLLIDLCAVKPDLMVTILINMKKVGEKMSRTARHDAFNMLDDEGLNLTVLEAEISDRNVIAGIVGLGVTVFEHQSKSSSEREAIAKASAEYKALAKEIIECLKETHSRDSVVA